MSLTSNDRAWIAANKGLFELRLHGRSWGIERISFIGEPVTAAARGRHARLGRTVATC